MRFFAALKNDVRYQIKYGFYFLYAFISFVYIVILLVCPAEYRPKVASIIILTDPALLGVFFIGGIWLLEKNEGLHSFWRISPLRPLEYIFSKALSLAGISALSAGLIVAIGLKDNVNYPLIIASVFFGSMVFTIIGLTVASYARSVNHYMILTAPVEIVVSLPPIIAVFGFLLPVFDVLPGMALWKVIIYSIGLTNSLNIWPFAAAVLWFCLALFFAKNRISLAMQIEGGEKA